MNRVRLALLAVAAASGIALLLAQTAHAVKVAPLSYNIELAQGQKKKGFIDVTNNQPIKVKFTFTVQAFKQINAQGDLQFFDDEKIRAGIALDYNAFEIEPGQTLRLAFLADGAKLPTGDSFGAIFATPAPREGAGATAVRVGTILTIQNGAPAEHNAEITGLTLPFFQVGSAIKGTYAIKNTSDPLKSAGFMPKVELTVDPIHKYSINQSSLVFAGIERQNSFSIQTNRFGFYRVKATFGGSSKESMVFFATPVGIAVFIGALVLVGILLVGITKMIRSPYWGARSKTKRHIPGRE